MLPTVAVAPFSVDLEAALSFLLLLLLTVVVVAGVVLLLFLLFLVGEEAEEENSRLAIACAIARSFSLYALRALSTFAISRL